MRMNIVSLLSASLLCSNIVLAQDAGSSDASQGACVADSLEPNDSSSAPRAITVPGELTGLTGCADEDWYSFTVPADNGVVVDLTFLDNDADLELYMYDASATATTLHQSTSSSDNEQVKHILFTAETNLLIRVKNFNSGAAWAAYSMTVALTPNPCTASQDSYEPNNEPASATPLTVATPLSASSCDDDWYSFTIPANNGVYASMTFLHDDADLNMYLVLASDPETVVASATSWSNDEIFSVEMFTENTPVLLRVKNNSANMNPTNYVLNAVLFPGGYELCDGEDSYEPNDDPALASAITVPGVTSELVGCDEFDWYSFTAPANNNATVRIDFTHADTDLDLYAYAADDLFEALEESIGTGDSETICIDAADVAQDLLVEVENYGGGRTDYTMTVTFAVGPCTVSQPDAGEDDDANVDTDADGTDSARTDAGQTGTDTGSTGSDSGSKGSDAGTDNSDGGCMGCASMNVGHSGFVAALILGLVAVLRRRQGN